MFWIGYFVLARLLFLLYENSLSFDLGVREWILIFMHGFIMDLSSTAYILTVVGLLFTFTIFTSGNWINKILKPFTIVILIISSIIVVADLELYANWGFRMDATPLLYITKPKEAMASTELWLKVILFITTVGLVVLGIFMYNKYIKNQVLKIKKTNIYKSLFLLLLTGSMIIPIRGGVGIAPMNTGMVYFSENKFSNHASINILWNVMHSLVYLKKRDKSYKFMDSKEANKIVKSLNEQKGKNIKILKTDRPNIVLLILESFSSKVVGAVNGKWDATPNLNKLSNEGILFTNFYANGDRSDKGLVSIISAYPAQPTTSIMKTASKTETLPSLFKSFNNIGYKTTYYYGGDPDFANMRSYFFNAGVQNIICDKNFDSKLVNSKWGVHDEYLLERLYNDLIKEDSLFFNAVFTLSSHEPFDVPMKPVLEGNDRETKYINSVYYTDSCLGVFFNKIKKTEVWNNTLFILVADHGSRMPGNSQNHQINKFQIPMLWLGGVLSDSIKVNNKVGSQIDISATLLNQLSLNSKQFIYSKDLFNKESASFAYYAFNDGCAYISDSSKLVYDNIDGRLLVKEGEFENDLIKAKAIEQVISEDYINR